VRNVNPLVMQLLSLKLQCSDEFTRNRPGHLQANSLAINFEDKIGCLLIVVNKHDGRGNVHFRQVLEKGVEVVAFCYLFRVHIILTVNLRDDLRKGKSSPFLIEKNEKCGSERGGEIESKGEASGASLSWHGGARIMKSGFCRRRFAFDAVRRHSFQPPPINDFILRHLTDTLLFGILAVNGSLKTIC
jgi:hypothetical protein